MNCPTPRATWLAVLALSLFLAVSVPAAVGGPAERPHGGAVTLQTLGLSRVAGRLATLDDKSLSLATDAAGAAQHFPLGEVIALRFAAPPPVPGRQPQFRAYLVGGERLVGTLVGPMEGGVTLDVPGLGRVGILFDVLLTLEAVPADATPCLDIASQHQRPKSGDAAYDRNDDEIRGTVERATKDGVILSSARGRKQAVAWKHLLLLHLENEALKAPTGRQAEVTLANGSRLPVATLGQADAGLSLRLRSLPKHTFEAHYESVAVVRWTNGRFVYASDLPYKAVLEDYYDDPEGLLDRSFYEGFVGTRVDRRARGCPLRMHGTTFRHGFGVNSHSTITIALDGKYATFRTMVGIDDEVLDKADDAKQRGNVDARVLGDGKVLWEAKGLRGGEKPRRVGPLDVAGVKSLVLEIGFGAEYMTLDRADWGDPILVKAVK